MPCVTNTITSINNKKDTENGRFCRIREKPRQFSCQPHKLGSPETVARSQQTKRNRQTHGSATPVARRTKTGSYDPISTKNTHRSTTFTDMYKHYRTRSQCQ